MPSMVTGQPVSTGDLTSRTDLRLLMPPVTSLPIHYATCCTSIFCMTLLCIDEQRRFADFVWSIQYIASLTLRACCNKLVPCVSLSVKCIDMMKRGCCFHSCHGNRFTWRLRRLNSLDHCFTDAIHSLTLRQHR